MSEAEVVDIADLQAALVRRKPREFGRPALCKHPQIDLIEESREIECRDCHARNVDAFTWLVELCHEPERLKYHLEMLNKWRVKTSVHAPGIGSSLLRCKAQPGGRWTVTISNKPEEVTCRQCKQRPIP